MGLCCSGGMKYSLSSERAVSAAEKECFNDWEPRFTSQPGVKNAAKAKQFVLVGRLKPSRGFRAGFSPKASVAINYPEAWGHGPDFPLVVFLSGAHGAILARRLQQTSLVPLPGLEIKSEPISRCPNPPGAETGCSEINQPQCGGKVIRAGRLD